ncbi:Os08g0420800, partial [Oryza sativa Japonica Group]
TLICQPELQIKLGHGRSPRAQNRAPRSSKHIPPSSHLLTGHRPAGDLRGGHHHHHRQRHDSLNLCLSKPQSVAKYCRTNEKSI